MDSRGRAREGRDAAGESQRARAPSIHSSPIDLDQIFRSGHNERCGELACQINQAGHWHRAHNLGMHVRPCASCAHACMIRRPLQRWRTHVISARITDPNRHKSRFHVRTVLNRSIIYIGLDTTMVFAARQWIDRSITTAVELWQRLLGSRTFIDHKSVCQRASIAGCRS